MLLCYLNFFPDFSDHAGKWYDKKGQFQNLWRHRTDNK